MPSAPISLRPWRVSSGILASRSMRALSTFVSQKARRVARNFSPRRTSSTAGVGCGWMRSSLKRPRNSSLAKLGLRQSCSRAASATCRASRSETLRMDGAVIRSSPRRGRECCTEGRGRPSDGATCEGYPIRGGCTSGAAGKRRAGGCVCAMGRPGYGLGHPGAGRIGHSGGRAGEGRGALRNGGVRSAPRPGRRRGVRRPEPGRQYGPRDGRRCPPVRAGPVRRGAGPPPRPV